MSDTTEPRTSESPVKRRLLLRRLSSEAGSDKKSKLSHGVPSQPSYRARGSTAATTDYSGDNDPPYTGTSSRFAPQSPMAYSSPTSSEGRDDLDHRRRDIGFLGKSSSQGGSQHLRQPSYPPPSHWQTGNKEGQASISSRSSNHHNQHKIPSASAVSSAVASRHPSPPPGFSLSSGQPLVNPPSKTQAAFVGKLYSMLEDDEIARTGLIHWSAEGTTFTCPNPTEFSKQVLPRFFKHNNWQSFVRQLNMYSFNKVSVSTSLNAGRPAWTSSDSPEQVNDIYSTTTDPQSWEFRHSLFRKGEPHLLASIKRKSSRPSAQETGQLSPTEEAHDPSRPLAGWMSESDQATFRLTSPRRSRRGESYSYGGEAPPHSARSEDDSSISRGGPWESRQPGLPQPLSSQAGFPPPPPLSDMQLHPPRFHPESGGLPIGASHRVVSPGYPESPLYPPPIQASSMDAAPGYVAFLEEKIQRLAELVNEERIEQVRNRLDTTSYLLQLAGWLAIDRPSTETRALQDTLSRQNADNRQKYEVLMASDALAVMASGGPVVRNRHGRLGRPESEWCSMLQTDCPNNSLYSGDHPSALPSRQPLSMQQVYPSDARPPQSSHGPVSSRSSPLFGFSANPRGLSSASLNTASKTSDGGQEGYSPHVATPPLPLNLARSSRTESSLYPPPHPSVPAPSPGIGARDREREREGYGSATESGDERIGQGRSAREAGYRIHPHGKIAEKEVVLAIDESEKKGGLRNLLN
ncbi:hypothetical protein IAR55_003853 [Kwoniella newhampshirensis]|uniref:HSF-type DNA-binding domain-containing protein n=1 Tax=Kwoniella newhampshirensis TaxID=1651941 RepID=A0AAW0YKU6_9TREE